MFCLTACIYVLQVFFDMYAHLYLCTVYMYFAPYLRNRKEQNDQFELITSLNTPLDNTRLTSAFHYSRPVIDYFQS